MTEGSATVRVVKRKWDRSVARVGPAELVQTGADATVWLVRAGTEVEHPNKGLVETLDRDEVWLAVPGEWWVLCGHLGAEGSVDEYVVHAAAPFEPPAPPLIEWIDLDLDFEVSEDHVALEDEAQFHEHARTMAYPDEVVRGAWSGISVVAASYTTGDWPFDGFIERCLQGRAEERRAQPSS